MIDSNPKTAAGGTHKVPFHLIPPRALAHVALCFADGGFKYQPYNWHVSTISSSVYYGAILRHVFAWWCGEKKAKDGHHHLAHATCCLLMVLDVDGTDLLHDNRPPPIGESFSDLLDSLSSELPGLRERENTRFDLHDIPTLATQEKERKKTLEEGVLHIFGHPKTDTPKIKAIKFYRGATGAPLNDAKEAVEAIMAANEVSM